MKRLVLAILLPALAACQAAPPPPPPAPPQASRRPATRPAPRAQPAPQAPELPAPAAEAASPAGTWRVRANGVVGCADAAGLRLLTELKANASAGPRLVAQAHRDGKCMTAFANRRWTLVEEEGELVRLHLADSATTLFFERGDVVPASGP